jgi:hypothetical protein
MLVATAEVLPRETDGVLVGKLNAQGDYEIDYAHPIQTAKRRYGSVDVGNKAAVQRMDNLLRAFNGTSEKPHVLGGYHSHPKKERTGMVFPSRGDLKGIREDLLPQHPGLDSWVEIIVQAYRPTFERDSEKGVKIFRRLNKLATTARYDPWAGFRFTTGAFLVYPQQDERGKNYRELRVELATL